MDLIGDVGGIESATFCKDVKEIMVRDLRMFMVVVLKNGEQIGDTICWVCGLFRITYYLNVKLPTTGATSCGYRHGSAARKTHL